MMQGNDHWPRWTSIRLLVAVIVITVVPVSFGFITKWIGSVLFPTIIGAGAIIIRPSGYSWFIPGYIAGFGCTGFVINFCYKLFHRLKFKNNRFFADTASTRNIEGHKGNKIFLVVMIALSLLASWLIHDNYILVEQGRISVDALTGLRERKYDAADIQSIQYKMPVGQPGDKREETDYMIRFADGYEFHSRDNFLSLEKIIPALERAAGIKADTILYVP